MAVEPLGLVTGFVPLCPDLQVASVVSQSGCASPVPSPGDAQSRLFALRLQWGCVLPENLGSWLKSLEEADIPFFP